MINNQLRRTSSRDGSPAGIAAQLPPRSLVSRLAAAVLGAILAVIGISALAAQPASAAPSPVSDTRIALADPADPITVSWPTPNYILRSGWTVDLSGTAPAGSHLTVERLDATGAVDPSATPTDLALYGTTWQATINAGTGSNPDGTQVTFRIEGTDAAGNPLTPATISYPLEAYADPAVTSPTPGSTVTSDMITMTGTGKPGASIWIMNGTTQSGASGIATTTVNADGTWSLTLWLSSLWRSSTRSADGTITYPMYVEQYFPNQYYGSSTPDFTYVLQPQTVVAPAIDPAIGAATATAAALIGVPLWLTRRRKTTTTTQQRPPLNN